MFSFFKGKLQRWAAKQQREELVYFIDMLKGANSEARATVVALATDFRNTVMQSTEFLKAEADDTDVLFLVQMYQAAQKANQGQIAAGIAVWIHTLRAEKEISNVYIAKEMWSLLAASFDQVEESAENLTLLMGGRDLDIEDFDRVPVGFS